MFPTSAIRSSRSYGRTQYAGQSFWRIRVRRRGVRSGNVATRNQTSNQGGVVCSVSSRRWHALSGSRRNLACQRPIWSHLSRLMVDNRQLRQRRLGILETRPRSARKKPDYKVTPDIPRPSSRPSPTRVRCLSARHINHECVAVPAAGVIVSVRLEHADKARWSRSRDRKDAFWNRSSRPQLRSAT